MSQNDQHQAAFSGSCKAAGKPGLSQRTSTNLFAFFGYGRQVSRTRPALVFFCS